MKLNHIRWNIPNILSTYRLLSAPFIIAFIFFGYEKLFIAFFIFNQITDILDGFIARRFKMTTEEGIILDSWADLGSYIIATCGIIKFHGELFSQPYVFWLIAFVLIYCSTIIIALIRYKKVVSGLHLYSSKINGYIQGSFLIVLFIYQLVPFLFYFSMVFGILSELECSSINLLSKSPVQNAKGLYWFIKSKLK